MQHVIIKYDEEAETPYIIPYRSQLWRDDQNIMWSFAAPNVRWDPLKPEPIVFQPANPETGVSAWPGSQPSPIGPPPTSGQDRRRYVADGGTPNFGDVPIKYMYDAWVEWDVIDESGRALTRTGKVQARPEHVEFRKIEPIDPEILNQPEP
jgi:hypothetical protein